MDLTQSQDTPAAAGFLETADIETSSDDYARRFAGPVGRWFLQVQEAATLGLLAGHPGATVLDVGGGHGQTAGALADHGYRVTVLGSAAVCQARLCELAAAGRVGFEVGDFLNLPYPDRAFDVALSYRLLPHVARWPRFLAELARVARRAVIVDYPDANSINTLAPALFGFKKRLEGNTRPFTVFREAQLLDAFRAAGFERQGRFAEFFLPMVLHRKLGRPALSARLEGLARALGLTGRWGSPVILKVGGSEGGG